MMRLFFLLLLFSNLAYFAWHLYHPPNRITDRSSAPLLNVPTLKLVSERSTVATTSSPPTLSTVSNTPNSELTKPGDAARSCYSLGPFEDPSVAESVFNVLTGMGKSVERRTTEQELTPSYWVYLPPHKSHSEALKVARRLARKGVKDYYVITETENRNAISLGLFRSESRTRRHIRDLRRLGVEPELDVRRRFRTLTWLDYEDEGSAASEPDRWDRLIPEGSKVRSIRSECGQIAQAVLIP